jgi:hypothetical protein
MTQNPSKIPNFYVSSKSIDHQKLGTQKTDWKSPTILMLKFYKGPFLKHLLKL